MGKILKDGNCRDVALALRLNTGAFLKVFS